MKVAIVHYWLHAMRGGEQVVEALCEMYPQADLFTHVYRPQAVSAAINAHRVHTTFIDRLPFSRRWHACYLPLMPLALEQLDLRAYDLVISSESGPAKGVITTPETLHVCYCHTPMRYLWDMYHDYAAELSWPLRWAFRPLAHRLRLWDLASAARVDHFVANSAFVARRIAKHYRREALVIHPPVDTEHFAAGDGGGDFFLWVGQLTAYKRPLDAVEACNRLRQRLVVIGDGEQLRAVRKRAGPGIEVLGPQPSSVVRDHYRRCRALLFPGIEDFGITAVEAMASGKPVIALHGGGAAETVVDRGTGLLYRQPGVEGLMQAIERFAELEASFDPVRLRAHAERFGKPRFVREFGALIETLTAARAGAGG